MGQVDAHAAALAFDAWMRAKPVDIGSTVRRGLLAFRKTGDPRMPPSEHDAGNGAAMRVLPVALATLGLLHQRAHPLTQQHPEFTFRAIAQRQNPSGYIVETVQAVFQTVFDTDSFEDCLIDVVNRGGDADTTGTIAGMLTGALYGPRGFRGVGCTGWMRPPGMPAKRRRGHF